MLHIEIALLRAAGIGALEISDYFQKKTNSGGAATASPDCWGRQGTLWDNGEAKWGSQESCWLGCTN